MSKILETLCFSDNSEKQKLTKIGEYDIVFVANYPKKKIETDSTTSQTDPECETPVQVPASDSKDYTTLTVKIKNTNTHLRLVYVTINSTMYIIKVNKKLDAITFDICSEYAESFSNKLTSLRVFFEQTADYKNNCPDNIEWLKIKECTQTITRDGQEIFDINTRNMKKVYDYHKDYSMRGGQVSKAFLHWSEFINGYMLDRYGLKEYIKAEKNNSVEYDTISSNTCSMTQIAPLKTEIRYYIHEINDHDELTLHFAVCKLITDALSEFY